jgi:hypothetical protein
MEERTKEEIHYRVCKPAEVTSFQGNSDLAKTLKIVY